MHEVPSARSYEGKGIYFAEASSKSDEYASDDQDGLHCMLLCKATSLILNSVGVLQLIPYLVEVDGLSSVMRKLKLRSVVAIGSTPTKSSQMSKLCYRKFNPANTTPSLEIVRRLAERTGSSYSSTTTKCTLST